jgi:hypothetical protein
MARRTKTITIPHKEKDNRDEGKTFFLQEMGAVQAEKWAMRVLIAISGPGTKIPNKAGLASLAEAGMSLFTMLGNIRWEQAEPLLNEMMQCVMRKESATVIRPLVEEDIDEITTLLMLRREVLELHLGFSLAEKFQTLGSEPPANSDSQTT